MERIVEIATKELEEKAKALKWEVEKAIDEKVEGIKNQLKTLAELKIPTDMLELYLQHGGKLWTSKRVSIKEYGFSLMVGGRNILYPKSDSREPEFKPPVGVYRLVLIALPSELEGHASFDDYGIPIET